MTKMSVILSSTFFLFVMMLFSFVGCGEEKEFPVKADVRITLVDNTGQPITDTEVWVSEITDMDMTYGYTTNSDGSLPSKILAREILP